GAFTLYEQTRHGPMVHVAISPDGRQLATACDEGPSGHPGAAVKVWDAEAGKLVRELEQTENFWRFGRIVFSPNGTWVSAAGMRHGGWDKSVWVWDAKTGQTREVFHLASQATCLAFSSDEKQLAVGSEDNTATLWDLQTYREPATYRS